MKLRTKRNLQFVFLFLPVAGLILLLFGTASIFGLITVLNYFSNNAGKAQEISQTIVAGDYEKANTLYSKYFDHIQVEPGMKDYDKVAPVRDQVHYYRNYRLAVDSYSSSTPNWTYILEKLANMPSSFGFSTEVASMSALAARSIVTTAKTGSATTPIASTYRSISGPLKDCTGPDGITFKATEEDCLNLNTFWKNPDKYAGKAGDGWDKKLAGEHTTVMYDIPVDDHMSTSDELFQAINTYRSAQGIPTVAKNETLCRIAQSRADEVKALGELDEHEGFEKFAKGQQEFNNMSEVMCCGVHKIAGVHIVEYMWDRSLTGHQDAIRDRSMSHGCGGIAGYFAVFIMGGN